MIAVVRGGVSHERGTQRAHTKQKQKRPKINASTLFELLLFLHLARLQAPTMTK